MLNEIKNKSKLVLHHYLPCIITSLRLLFFFIINKNFKLLKKHVIFLFNNNVKFYTLTIN